MLALVVSLVIVIAGLQAISSLNVRQYPRSDIASVTVTTVYVGASADLVRGFITTPLERAIAAADGIDYLQSQQHAGRLDHHRAAEAELRLEQGALRDQLEGQPGARTILPPGSGNSGDQHRVGRFPIRLRLSQFHLRHSAGERDHRLSHAHRAAAPDRARRRAARGHSRRAHLRHAHLAQAGTNGGAQRQPGAGSPGAGANNNFLAALGSTKGALVQVNLTANTDLHTVEDFKNLVIRQENGTLVRLGDIADVVLGAEDYNTEVRFSGQRAVFMGIFVLPNANSIDVVKRVRTEMEQIQKELPTGMEGRIAYDGTAYINTAINDVFHTLIETLLIVCVVIFLFLGSWRSVIIPIVAIPISLIGAVFLMQIFGFTVNLLTLLAIVLSVGLVVDDAIVVVENVERHLREGLTPLNAALLGARELVGPIIAMTITLAAVYIPIGIQGGLTGTLFREFAFTLAGAVTISGVVALTLSPVMTAKFLRAGDEERGFAGKVNHTFDRLRDWYGRHARCDACGCVRRFTRPGSVSRSLLRSCFC